MDHRTKNVLLFSNIPPWRLHFLRGQTKRGATLQQDCPQELADYLLARAGESWMHELMAACQEISWDDVEALRSCGDLFATNAPAKIDAEAPAPPISADDETPEKNTRCCYGGVVEDMWHR